jgi:phosphoglycerate dehydrogenase-like enzyme
VELGIPQGFHRVVSFDGIDGELPTADIVILAMPLTPLTKGLLSPSRLNCLPRGAIVVNVARGNLLDVEALASGLASGRLRGAVLDVFDHEPLPPESPLWKLPNALITPHVAAVSPRRFWERELDLFLENWTRYREGRPLRNHVDKDAGY